MFSKDSAQKISHSDGHTVQVADRTTVEYLENGRRASVEVDFGVSVGVFVQTLRGWDRDGSSEAMSVAERNLTLERIGAGLRAMGCKVELC